MSCTFTWISNPVNKVDDEVGFVLPADELKRVLIRFGALLALGVVVAAVLGARLPIAGAVFVLLLCLAGYVIGKRYKYVYVSESGIRGTTISASRVRLQWKDGVSIAKTRFNGLDGITLVPEGRKRGLYIPLAIARSAEFGGTVAKYAPHGHVLVRFIKSEFTE